MPGRFHSKSGGIYTILPSDGNSINNTGEVTGGGFVYSGGFYTILSPPGSIGSGNGSGNSINDFGAVAGYFYNGAKIEGFVYSNGTYSILDPPGSEWPVPVINNSGTVAGYSMTFNAAGNIYSFVYSDGVYTSIDVPGSGDTIADSINDSGAIAGYFWEGQGNHGFVATLPEPSTWAMMLLGFAGLGYAGYRRARAVAALAPA